VSANETTVREAKQLVGGEWVDAARSDGRADEDELTEWLRITVQSALTARSGV
jgi:hypothetical protein